MRYSYPRFFRANDGVAALAAGAILCAIAFFRVGNVYWHNYWVMPWMVAAAIALLVLGGWIGFKTHWSVVPLFLSTTLGALWGFARPEVVSAGEILDVMTLGKHSAITAFSVVVLAVAVCLLRWTQIAAALIVMAALSLIASIMTLYQAIWAGSVPGGFLGNPSMNGCFIAMTSLVFFMREKGIPLWPHALAGGVSIAAVIATDSSIPVGVLALGLATLRLRSVRQSSRWLPVVGVFVGIAAISLQGSKFFNSSGRFELWVHALKWWSENANPWFGTGPGTAKVWLPVIQREAGYTRPGWFIFMHSEPIQVLFEQGLVGLLSLLLLFGCALVAAKNRPVVFASLTAFGATALLNYPFSLPMTALYGMVLLRSAFLRKEDLTHG